MLVSFNWLKKYVRLPDSVTALDLAAKLNLSTVEVEKVISAGAELENIVVGKILTLSKHPNADKLTVCQVDLGEETADIVCGGSNLREGMLVAVAKPGAKVRWHGAGDLVELQETVIRGVKSRGMICASSEIGLENKFPAREEKEIIGLKDIKAQPGTPLSEALGLDDAILEIDNKSLSHRPDLWGHYGLAREAAMLFNDRLAPYDPPKIRPGKALKLKVKVEDSKLCPRYMAVAMSGIKVEESPDWLKEALSSVGMRPVNNIVDVTNYVMADLGEPMHAFDAEAVSKSSKNKNSKMIVVRPAKEGEEFMTLDGQKQFLKKDVLVIADEEAPLAIAGVMGGAGSGIKADTKTIILEAANFESASIRRASNRLGLRTDSALRFEKGLDPNLCSLALERAVELVKKVCPSAVVSSAVADEADFSLATGPIEMKSDIFEKKLGLNIPVKTAVVILGKLGFDVKEKNKGVLSVKIPTWRAGKDVALAEDVVEEVARIYGFNNIPSALPSFPIIPPLPDNLRMLVRKTREILSQGARGTEVYNYSFISPSDISGLGETTEKYLELSNPLSKERPFLRRTLLAGLLGNIRRNIENFSEVRLFEIGNVYLSEEPGPRLASNSDKLLPRQDTRLCFVFSQKGEKNPYFEARRAGEELLAGLRLPLNVSAPKEILPWEHPGRSAEITGGKNGALGRIFELSPLAQKRFNLEARAGVLEINLTLLSEIWKNQGGSYEPLPIYPEAERDLAFLVDKAVRHDLLLALLSGSDPLLKKAELFDVYEGVAEGKKSMAYRLTFAHPERTLESAEVDAAMEKIVKILEKKFGVEVRK